MKAEQLGLEFGQALTKVNSIKSSIENIFNVIQCDVKAHQELLGTQGVTESNMMTYMGIIE
jgi:coiled-coil domain-containing protein 63/114